MVSEPGSGPDELAPSPAENPAATAPDGVAAEEPVATAPPAHKPPAKAPPVKKRPWWARRYTFTGTAVGLVFLWLSMTPSLLPRGPLFQALVSGVSGAIGYALGVLAVWLVR
jgi:uncharacterized membrane protein